MTASPGPEAVSVTGSGSTTGPVHFIADAHLGIESEERERVKAGDLVSLLDHLRGRSSLLYLVGDTFDFWFEYPWKKPSAHSDVTDALARLVESGTPVRFLGGNHDYWAGRQLEQLTGATVHRTPVTASHFGRRVFVAHGDGLPEGDLSYKFLKAIIRNPIAIAAYTLIPPRAGAAIARWASDLSDITEERIDRATPPMRKFLESKLAEGYDVTVVGHVHRQMVWDANGGTAVVVGDWMEHRSVVELTDGGVRPLRWSDGSLVEESPAAPRG